MGRQGRAGEAGEEINGISGLPKILIGLKKRGDTLGDLVICIGKLQLAYNFPILITTNKLCPGNKFEEYWYSR